MPLRFPEFPATPRMPEGPTADAPFVLHDDKQHRKQREAQTEELKLGRQVGVHKKTGSSLH
jgi:hypothetical protein